MAGTTSNYGFPYPTGTDSINTGDTKIQDLAQSIEDFIDGSVASGKLFDRVLNVQTSTAYSRSVSSTGFVTLNSPSVLEYTFDLGKSGVALISFGGNMTGSTGSVNYYISPDITGASITGFGAAQGQSIASTGTGRQSGGCTLLVDGTAGGTVTVAIQGKSSSATASTLTLNDHFITALLLG